MVRLALLILPLIALAACQHENSQFCQLHPGDQGCPDARTTGGACQLDTDCPIANLRVCDPSLNAGTCVQCTSDKASACQDTTPACVNDVCQKCTMHAQCASKACLADGRCASATDVAYVRPTGSGTACTDTAPCKTLNDAIDANKPIIKIEGAITDADVATFDGKAVKILANPGSTLTCSRSGALTLEVKNGGADVSVYDLEITGGTGAKTDTAVALSGSGTPKLALTNVKIDNNVGNGVGVIGGGVLTVTSSTISGNGGIGITMASSSLTVNQSTISVNASGGISITGNGGTAGDFDLTNNFITGNGGGATTFGGIFINNSETSKRKIEFNTIASNLAATGTPAGVRCMSVDQDTTFSSNIVYFNFAGVTTPQIEGTHCNWTFSDIEAITPVTGTGNKNTDPKFASIVSANFHLMADSPVKDMADPNATLTVDFDGDQRPHSLCDMGADEIKP